MCSVEEKRAVDQIIDSGPRLAGEMDFTVLHGAYMYTETDPGLAGRPRILLFHLFRIFLLLGTDQNTPHRTTTRSERALSSRLPPRIEDRSVPVVVP